MKQVFKLEPFAGHDNAACRFAHLRLLKAFFASKGSAGAGIEHLFAIMRGVCRVKIGSRAEAWVHELLLLELFISLTVSLGTLALVQGLVVPFEAQSIKAAKNRIDVCLLLTRRVKVLDAH